VRYLISSVFILITSLQAQIMPVCEKCLNPRVTTKTGIGTANAVVEAKVTPEDAAVWCAANRPRDKYCVQEEVKNGGDGGRTSYRGSANCTTGEMRSINGADLLYAGVWPDGPGKGRPMMKDGGGNIRRWLDIVSGYGKARTEWDDYGGYSLTGQFEVLCPGVAPQISKAAPAPAAAKPAPAAPAAEKEWLSLCRQCDNPDVFSKTGTGTANSVAQARLASEGPRGKIYRASANCTTGRITTAQEETFTLAGVWDNSDIGGGRTKWRAADGQIRGRDNASEGLAISQQWEVLCPGPLSPALLAQANAQPARPAAAAAAQPARPQAARPQPAAPAPTASACTGKRYCDEGNSFAAIVTDFRPSIYDSSTRIVSATVKFLNKTNAPLILGYIRNSGVAIDEQGNRYTLPAAENVRGIAEITGGRDFDPKFRLLPGQTADARFEFVWRWNGRDIIGQNAWDIDLTVREVNEVAPGQYRFGQEHALQFKGVPARPTNTAPAGAAPATLTSAAPANAPVNPPAAVAPPPAPAGPPPAPEPDACQGRTRCYDAGPFVTEILTGTLTHEGNFEDRVVRLNLRFRNKTSEPLILAYVARTSVLSDNFGNRFSWGSGYDNSATGIGKVESNKADPQFVLRPGESRSATFTVFRRRPARNSPDGSGYTYEVTMAQLEVLYNGQQVRTQREHVLTFPEFALNGPSALPGVPGPNRPAPQSIKEASDALKDIFKKKK
jgi:hypothetical protein